MSETLESFYPDNFVDIEKIKRHKINFPTSKQIKSVFQAISNIHLDGLLRIVMK